MAGLKEVAAVAALIVGGAAGAQMTNHNGAELVARGNYAAAERVIVSQQRVFPRDADLLLNLAVVYARTGRADQARRTYAKVLTLPDEALSVAGRPVIGSHMLAVEGMRRLAPMLASMP